MTTTVGIIAVIVVSVPAWIAVARTLVRRSSALSGTVKRWGVISIITGTVFSTVGLVRVFAEVANADAAAKATLLAKGISELTPPFYWGLAIGLSMMFFSGFVKGYWPSDKHNNEK